MAFPISLDEELFWMPPKPEHFAVTRLELLHAHLRRLTRVRLTRRLIRALHVSLSRARTRTSFSLLYVRSVTLNLCLSAHVCSRLRFCLRFGLLLRGAHFLRFRWGGCLRFVGLPLRLLRLRLLA